MLKQRSVEQTKVSRKRDYSDVIGIKTGEAAVLKKQKAAAQARIEAFSQKKLVQCQSVLSCPSCEKSVTVKQVQSGWLHDPEDYTSLCPHCKERVAFQLSATYEGYVDTTVWLCPEQLESAFSEWWYNNDCNAEVEQLIKSQPTILWNLINYFHDLDQGWTWMMAKYTQPPEVLLHTFRDNEVTTGGKKPEVHATSEASSGGIHKLAAPIFASEIEAAVHERRVSTSPIAFIKGAKSTKVLLSNNNKELSIKYLGEAKFSVTYVPKAELKELIEKFLNSAKIFDASNRVDSSTVCDLAKVSLDVLWSMYLFLAEEHPDVASTTQNRMLDAITLLRA